MLTLWADACVVGFDTDFFCEQRWRCGSVEAGLTQIIVLAGGEKPALI